MCFECSENRKVDLLYAHVDRNILLVKVESNVGQEFHIVH